MVARPFKSPDDLDTMVKLIKDGFQYPENEAWSIQDDKVENIADEVAMIRKLRFLFKFLGLFFSPIKDMMSGYIWEEDGKAVALVNVSPKGLNKSAWTIGNVVVLPEHRRKGIARKLVTATIDYARRKKADTVMLDVIAGNTPALKLYESLGFENYGGVVELEYDPTDKPTQEQPLPPEYSLIKYESKDWKLRYELTKRITPDIVQKYEAVTKSRFHRPLLMRAVRVIVLKLAPFSGHLYLIRHDGSDTIVGQIHYMTRKNEGGINEMEIMLDPAHSNIAGALVNTMVSRIVAQAPGRRIEMFMARWQNHVIDAVQRFGFTQRCEGYTMGIVL